MSSQLMQRIGSALSRIRPRSRRASAVSTPVCALYHRRCITPSPVADAARAPSQRFAALEAAVQEPHAAGHFVLNNREIPIGAGGTFRIGGRFASPSSSGISRERMRCRNRDLACSSAVVQVRQLGSFAACRVLAGVASPMRWRIETSAAGVDRAQGCSRPHHAASVQGSRQYLCGPLLDRVPALDGAERKSARTTQAGFRNAG